jgi:hypothetical protein
MPRPDNDALDHLPTDLQFARSLILLFVAVALREQPARNPPQAIHPAWCHGMQAGPSFAPCLTSLSASL